MDVHPPIPRSQPKVWRWRQDGGRQNLEVETEPQRPLLSMRTSFWLSDASQPGRGNFMCIPGSHRTSKLPRPERPELGFEDPAGAIEVCPNRSDRWIAPHEDRIITPAHPWWDELTPIQRQLLGGGKDAISYWGVGGDRYPLRDYLAERGLLDAKINNNR